MRRTPHSLDFQLHPPVLSAALGQPPSSNPNAWILHNSGPAESQSEASQPGHAGALSRVRTEWVHLSHSAVSYWPQVESHTDPNSSAYFPWQILSHFSHTTPVKHRTHQPFTWALNSEHLLRSTCPPGLGGEGCFRFFLRLPI